MVLDLALYTKDPDGTEDAVNIFIFPYFIPTTGSEAALMARCWDIILGGGELMYFADTSLLTVKQKATPITG